MKKCSKCQENKQLNDFYKNPSSKDGYRSQCKTCRKPYDLSYYSSNQDHKLIYYKTYRDNNKEKIASREKKYRKQNKESILTKKKEYNKKRYKEDPIYNVTCRMRALIRSSLNRKGFLKNTETAEILGINWNSFWDHLTNSFKNNYNIEFEDKYLVDVEIDHIIPVSSGKTEAEIIRLNHYSNLQFLWRKDNLKKSNNMI